jgi:hypothetical protein
MATDIQGGMLQAIPDQAAVIKFGLPLTNVPISTAGIGYSRVLGPIFFFIVFTSLISYIIFQILPKYHIFSIVKPSVITSRWWFTTLKNRVF